MLKKVLPHFGEAVTAVLKEHGLSDRAAQYRTGIDRITIADMRNGYVPRMEQVVRFARGFGLSVGDWLELAGYERLEEAGEGTHLHDERQTYRMLPQEEGEEESGRRILLEGLVALNKKHNRPLAISLDESALAALTPEKARATLKFWDEQAAAGII